MPDPSQPTPTPFERPSARAVSGMPVQRGNYGIPPRPVAPQPQAQPLRPMMRPPQPSGPRSMDIMPPRPSAPAVPRPQPIQQPTAPMPAPIAPTLTQSVPVVEQISVTRPVSQPLYTNRPTPAEVLPTEHEGRREVLPRVRLVLLIFAAILTLGGATRWLTAGSTSGDLIAAGAIAANDGNTMTVQFTANDGQMHKFTDNSDKKLIPGSGVQVAYRSGAPDNSAKRVEPINAAHRMGVMFVTTAVILFLTAGLATLLMYRRPKHAKSASIAQPVTV